MEPRSFKEHREPDGSWAHIRGAESVTVLEVVWANETPRQMSQELSDYKRKGLNVILINIKWRQTMGRPQSATCLVKRTSSSDPEKFPLFLEDFAQVSPDVPIPIQSLRSASRLTAFSFILTMYATLPCPY